MKQNNYWEIFKWEKLKICFMLQKNRITFYRKNELWKAKEKHGDYRSVQARDEKGLD